MTQETIDKFLKIEEKRGKWRSFRDVLMVKKNIAVINTNNKDGFVSITKYDIDDWNEFQDYILAYLDKMIAVYDKQIEEL